MVEQGDEDAGYAGNAFDFNILAEADPLDRDKEFYKKPPFGDSDGISITAQDYSFPIYKYKTKINKFVSICDDINKYNKIGIITQCSVDRLNRLKAMVQRWKNGVISVSIYIKNLNELFIIKNIWNEFIKPKCNKNNISIFIHLVFANDTNEYYPINYLRNIALKNCNNCQYVFLLDIDLIPSQDLYDKILNNLPSEKELLVIPAFQFKKEHRTNIKYHPKNKKELVERYKNGDIEQFAIHFIKGHKLTDYQKWLNDTDDGYPCYNIDYDIKNKKHWYYEPYVVVKNDNNLSFYDERFTGYGMNKIIHIANLAIKQKYKFKVLKNGFVTSSKHAISNDRFNTYNSKRLAKERKKWIDTLFNTALNEIIPP